MDEPARKPFIGQLAALNNKWMEVARDDARLRNEQIKVAQLKGLIEQKGREEAFKQSLQLTQTLKRRIEQKGKVLMREAKRMTAIFMQMEIAKDLLENPDNAHKKPDR